MNLLKKGSNSRAVPGRAADGVSTAHKPAPALMSETFTAKGARSLLRPKVEVFFLPKERNSR